VRSDVAGALLGVAAGNEDGAFVAEFRFDPALAVFRGHFPGRPLVPGAFEIEMVRQAVECHTGLAWRIARVASAKFTGQVAPGETINVAGTAVPAERGLAVNATLRVRGEVRAKLAMRLEPCPGPSEFQAPMQSAE